MGIYNINLPFDNMITCISSIKQCIENDFVDFLDKHNYEKIHTKTFPHKETLSGFLYDETIWVNKKYQPYSLLYPLNTYQYKLAMINHSIVETPEDCQYYRYCVNQFTQIFYSKENKMPIYISPVYTMEEFYERYDEIVGEITDFQVFLEEKIYKSLFRNLTHRNISTKTKTRSLFFILVKNHLENRPHITVVKHATIGKLYEYKILLLHTNSGLLDAGTTFMGECSEEENLIQSNIEQYLYF